MRLFIRHPTDVPIEIQDAPEHGYVRQATQDIGFGGLAFISTKAFEPECLIALRIPCLKPAFEVAMARVTWCHSSNSHFAIGVEFLDSAEAFRVRMIEQICHNEKVVTSAPNRRQKNGSAATPRRSPTLEPVRSERLPG